MREVDFFDVLFYGNAYEQLPACSPALQQIMSMCSFNRQTSFVHFRLVWLVFCFACLLFGLCFVCVFCFACVFVLFQKQDATTLIGICCLLFAAWHLRVHHSQSKNCVET